MKRALFWLLPLALAATGLQAQWTDDPQTNTEIAVKAGSLVQAKFVASPDGGAFVSWMENTGSGFDVFLQRLDAEGNRLWGADGVQVAQRGFTSTEDYGLDIDSAGHAVMAFRYDGAGATRIAAQRISPAGQLVWGSSGVFLSDGSGFVASPRIAATSDGGIVAAHTGDAGTVVSRLNPDGAIEWTATVSGANLLALSDLRASDAPGQSGQVIVLSRDLGPPFLPGRLHAQKFDAQGQALWGDSPVSVFDTGSLQLGNFPEMVADGSGGMAVAWYRSQPTLDVFVQHLDADGQRQLPGDGLAVSTNDGQLRTNPALVLDAAASNYFVFWRETDTSQNSIGLYGQRLDAAGERLWGAAGQVLIALGESGDIGSIDAVLLDGDPVVSFISDNGSRLRAVRLDAQGQPVWDPAFSVLSRDSGAHARASTTAELAGSGAVSVWQDDRAGDSNIYAQRFNPDGSLGAPTAAPGTGGPQLLMRSGPGSAFQVPLNTTWSSKTPAINDAGRVAMSVNSVAGTGNAGVWSGDRNGGGIIDTAADASALYTDVDINNAGQVAWIRRESAQNGILRYDPMSGETEFLTNAPLGASSWVAISINNSGQVGYRAGFGFAGNAWVSYDANTGAAVHLAEDGVDSNSPYVFLFTPAFNDQRRIAGRADLGAVGNSQIVVVDPDGSIQVLAEVNVLDPDSPFTSFRNSVGLNGLGQVAFMAALSGGGTGVFVADGDGIQQYALEGEDGLASIEFFGPAINNTGGVVFRGFNDQGDRAIWYADGEQVIAVATRGDEVEIDVGTAILAAADAFGPTSPNFGGAPDIGDNGDITFVSLLTDPNDTSVNFGRGVFVVTVDGPREDRLFSDRFETE